MADQKYAVFVIAVFIWEYFTVRGERTSGWADIEPNDEDDCGSAIDETFQNDSIAFDELLQAWDQSLWRADADNPHMFPYMEGMRLLTEVGHAGEDATPEERDKNQLLKTHAPKTKRELLTR